jgi:hypothetical protein
MASVHREINICNIFMHMFALIMFFSKNEKPYNIFLHYATTYFNILEVSNKLINFTRSFLYADATVAPLYVTIHTESCLVPEHHAA